MFGAIRRGIKGLKRKLLRGISNFIMVTVLMATLLLSPGPTIQYQY